VARRAQTSKKGGCGLFLAGTEGGGYARVVGRATLERLSPQTCAAAAATAGVVGGISRTAGGLEVGAARQKIMTSFGVMYQQGALFGSMTLLENVRLFMEEYTHLSPSEMNLLARCKLDLVGLLPFANFMPSEISGGMQKRAAIARAMALDPKILFLDEPSAGLDPVTSADLDSTIIELSRNLGITFIVVSHELASIYAIADRVIMLDKDAKGIIAEGDPRQLREQKDNPKAYQFFNRVMSKDAA
jgi:phospholipid/cholesterol/gamma-HCH transport system ATP-binding protein